MIRQRRARAVAAVAIAVALGGLGAFGAVGTASAAPGVPTWTNGACTDPTDVTVIIDFQELGGGVHTRCAPQSISTGFDALRQAGIDYTTTVRFPGFICKIAGKPANDPCQTASPASAYWSYWIANRGGTWCYSNWGAGNRRPTPGSVEAWSFSLNKSAETAPPPRVAVPAPVGGTAAGSLPHNDCDPNFPGNPSAPATQPPAAAPPTTAASPRRTNPATGGSGGSTGSDPGANPGNGSKDSGSGSAGSGAVPPLERPDGTLEEVDPGDRADRSEDPLTLGVAPGDTAAASSVPTEVEAGDVAADDESTDGPDGGGGVDFADETTASVDLGGDGRSSGSPLGVIAAVVLVAALVGGAYYFVRRHDDPEAV